jgi:hypothetical protein
MLTMIYQCTYCNSIIRGLAVIVSRELAVPHGDYLGDERKTNMDRVV